MNGGLMGRLIKPAKILIHGSSALAYPFLPFAQRKLMALHELGNRLSPSPYLYHNRRWFAIGDTIRILVIASSFESAIHIFAEVAKELIPSFVFVPASIANIGGWGEPFEDAQAVFINPPLGTVGGLEPENVIFSDKKNTVRTHTLKRQFPGAETPPLAGNIDWRWKRTAKDDKLITWKGPYSRCIAPGTTRITPTIETLFQDAYEEKSYFDYISFRRWDNFVYLDGEVAAQFTREVLGAAVKTINGIDRLVVIVLVNSNADNIYISTDANWDTFNLVATIDYIALVTSEGLNWAIGDRMSPYFFNESCSRASTTVIVDTGTSALGSEFYTTFIHIDFTVVGMTLSAIVSIEPQIVADKITTSNSSTSPPSGIGIENSGSIAATVRINSTITIPLAIEYDGDIEKRINIKRTFKHDIDFNRVFDNVGNTFSLDTSFEENTVDTLESSFVQFDVSYTKSRYDFSVTGPAHQVIQRLRNDLLYVNARDEKIVSAKFIQVTDDNTSFDRPAPFSQESFIGTLVRTNTDSYSLLVNDLTGLVPESGFVASVTEPDTQIDQGTQDPSDGFVSGSVQISATVTPFSKIFSSSVSSDKFMPLIYAGVDVLGEFFFSYSGVRHTSAQEGNFFSTYGRARELQGSDDLRPFYNVHVLDNEADVVQFVALSSEQYPVLYNMGVL